VRFSGEVDPRVIGGRAEQRVFGVQHVQLRAAVPREPGSEHQRRPGGVGEINGRNDRSRRNHAVQS